MAATLVSILIHYSYYETMRGVFRILRSLECVHHSRGVRGLGGVGYGIKKQN